MAKMRPGVITLEALTNLFQKPATTEYAGKGEPPLERNYHGRLLYDPTSCVDCKLCMKDCPTGAIEIINEGTRADKKMKALLDVGKCIFCCQCVDSCNKSSLSFSQIVDLASSQKEDLIIKL